MLVMQVMWLLDSIQIKNKTLECENVSNVGNVDDYKHSDLKTPPQNVRMLVMQVMLMINSIQIKNTASECDNVSNVGNVDG